MPRVSESAVVIEVRQAAPVSEEGHLRLAGPAEPAPGPAGLPRGAAPGREALGVTVSEDEISKRLAAAGQPDTGQNGDSYAHDSIEAQLIYERIFRKLTRHSKGEDAG
jgi:hypothetical protein